MAFRIEVPNVNELYVAQIRKDLEAWPGFNYQNWATAALFAASNRIDLDEALTWANRAIYEPFRGAAVGVMNFSTLQVKATVLQAMGRQADADTTMDRAIRLPGTNARSLYQYGAILLAEKRTPRALATFKLNRELHSEDKFWTSLGLARGYAASGDKQNAIANWEIVLRNVPPAQMGSIPAFEKALEKLKASSE
jgi:tetratricopeptide (TPR) repeat protein